MEETVLSCHVGSKGQKQLTSLAAPFPAEPSCQPTYTEVNCFLSVFLEELYSNRFLLKVDRSQTGNAVQQIRGEPYPSCK